jgi:hypothetical protein
VVEVMEGEKNEVLREPRHTFVNHLVALLEDMQRWESDDAVSKEDMCRSIRTSVLKCMRAGLVHPFTTFYSLEASTVMQRPGVRD